MNYSEALGLARYLISTGMSIDDVISNPAIPSELRDGIKQVLEEERTIIFQPARMIIDGENHIEWLTQEDRSQWHYWPALRQYLLTTKGLSNPSVQSLDKETDRILERLASPHTLGVFDKRGLVLGYVQSGKTSNYTALIAKAADSGYRLIIVLAGMDNGLRLQTHRRLKRELVGIPGSRRSVPVPPVGSQWHEFTLDNLDGDFQPGYANSAALQGSQPVLLVIKKNGTVLRRLLSWLDSASEEIMRTIPLMVIDDEADLASIDTRGSYQSEEEPLPEDYEEPSVINRLIRRLLNKFHKKAYVAYTATPFANILIPHDNYDPSVSDDLYPKNFIVDLPKPPEYFGAEELFGRMDETTEEDGGGLDIVRNISDEDLILLQSCQLPPVIRSAILSFILAGAARSYRETNDFPATMLIHISLRIYEQFAIKNEVDKMFTELRDEWRYNRKGVILEELKAMWDQDFKSITENRHPDKVIEFEALESHIGSFFESVQIRILNSWTGDVLDYEAEPTLKAIAIGGNKLSRGLTLEGLLVSVFVRRTVAYDTLMQMGRWFGYRNGYEDLTRIYTTAELAEWFSDLALVEHRLRDDISIYEEQQLTPLQVGMRIRVHPTLQVTSSLKRRFASETRISQSYSGQVEQTFKFPLRRPEDLAAQSERNLIATKEFFSNLGEPGTMDEKGPQWFNVTANKIIDFLGKFTVDEAFKNISLQLIIQYIKKQEANGELLQWTIAICGRESLDPNLGDVDWGTGARINQIRRSRLKDTESLGVITSPGDEMIGLSTEQVERMQEYLDRGEAKNKAARRVRSPEEGLLLIYPISKNSKPMSGERRSRIAIYEDQENSLARDLIGIALSFPHSNHPQPVEAYLQGTLPWRPVE